MSNAFRLPGPLDVLDAVNYRETDNAARRRSSLKTAVRRHGRGAVENALGQLENTAEKEYRRTRIQRDINWLRKEFTGASQPIL